MYKFFVKANQIEGNKVQIIGEDVNHIKNVLRLQPNENIQVCNIDEEKTYITKILEIQPNKIIVEIMEEFFHRAEPNILLHIFQGLPKQEKMEQIIQKATEIGVKDITPVKMERCVVKLDEKSFKNLYEILKKYDIVIVAYEEEKQINIKQVLKDAKQNNSKEIAIIIGPEGGIAKEEIEFLNTLSNVKIVTLGKRILRTETAPLVLASIIMYEFDEME